MPESSIEEIVAPMPCLPCPFDGGRHFTVVKTDRFGNSPPDEPEAFHYNVRCTSCGTEGPFNKTSAESACRQWNRRTIHGLDLSQFSVVTADKTTCPDCGRHPLMLAPIDPEFYMLGQSPFFWLCYCGAIRQAGREKPIAPSQHHREAEPTGSDALRAMFAEAQAEDRRLHARMGELSRTLLGRGEREQ